MPYTIIMTITILLAIMTNWIKLVNYSSRMRLNECFEDEVDAQVLRDLYICQEYW